jgi:hypothetical protein
MFDQVRPAAEDDPIVLRPSAGAAWVWVALAAFFVFALIRGYLGAATTAGRIGVVIFTGDVHRPVPVGRRLHDHAPPDHVDLRQHHHLGQGHHSQDQGRQPPGPGPRALGRP